MRGWRWALILGALLYLVLGIASLEVNWARAGQGLERGWALRAGLPAARLHQPLGRHRDRLQESLTMTVTSTAWACVVDPGGGGRGAQPGAALDLPVLPGFIALSRTLNEIIVAIFLVAMFGFGPFAGFLTLTFATIGFMAKLMAEDIEEIEPDQLEALRATGAGYLQVLDFAVLSQVMPRLVGLSLYRLDINFRESR
jgi:phosphonate transport system permease protein